MRPRTKPISRPGNASRAVVIGGVLLLLLAGAVFSARRWTGIPQPPATDPTAEAAGPEAAKAIISLRCTVARIARDDEGESTVRTLLSEIGEAPSVAPELADARDSDLASLAAAGLATIESQMTLTVFDGQAGSISVTGGAPNTDDQLELTLKPRLLPSGEIGIELTLRSAQRSGTLEMWAADLGVELGERSSLETGATVSPGGSAGAAVAVRGPVSRQGTLVVLVRPTLLPVTPTAPDPSDASNSP